MQFKSLTSVFFALTLAATACAPSARLAEKSCVLVANEVRITDDGSFDPSTITPYIKQQPKALRKIGSKREEFKPSLAKASCQSIRNHLAFLGYYSSSVTTDITYRRNGRRAVVKYTVELGDRIPIDEVVYNLPDDSFRQDLFGSKLFRDNLTGKYLSEDLLEKEAAGRASLMRNLGYYNISKSSFSFYADTLTRPGKAILEYNVTPQTKHLFGKVTITHSPEVKIRPSVLTSLNTVKPGDVFNESALKTTYNRLSSLRLFSTVSMSTSLSEDGRVDCGISLDESMLQGFKVNMETSTNSNGLIGLSPQFNYYHKNVFHGGEWLNLGFTGNFQFRLNEKAMSEEYGISASLSFPKFLGLPYSAFKGSAIPRTEVSLSYNYHYRPEYSRSVLSTSFGYTGSIGGSFFYQFYPLQLSYVNLYGLTEDFSQTLSRNPFLRYSYSDHFDASVGGTIYHTTNPDIIPRTSYRFTRLTTDFAGNLLSLIDPVLAHSSTGESLVLGVPYTRYVRAEIQTGGALRFGRNDGAALAARFIAGAGYAFGNSETMPFEKQFSAGGASSMRGWQTRSLGPGDEQLNRIFLIPSQTGDVKLEADLELRQKLFWKLESALFAECGNVWTTGQIKSFWKTLAFDWGAGLRLDLDFILLRIDLGIKLYDPAGGGQWRNADRWFESDGFTVHFGVGYPF